MEKMYKNDPPIDSATKPNGYLILHLNKIEMKYEHQEFGDYQEIIKNDLPNFYKVYHKDNLMIYKKQLKKKYL